MLTGQPLREAVSWNTWSSSIYFPSSAVSLFVRLWVEITMLRCILDIHSPSASSWGCELKYLLLSQFHFLFRVSLFVRLWVEMITSGEEPGLPRVSLFVRLWVEIYLCLITFSTAAVSLFVRLWVEMSSLWRGFSFPPVSLFVRLWVEITMLRCILDIHSPSASSWGCELKYRLRPHYNHAFCQPLREAVSWNNVVYFVISPFLGQPLREAVSWNMIRAFLRCDQSVSASSWGCELKYAKRHIVRCSRAVSLFVRLWVEIYDSPYK